MWILSWHSELLYILCFHQLEDIYDLALKMPELSYRYCISSKASLNISTFPEEEFVKNDLIELYEYMLHSY